MIGIGFNHANRDARVLPFGIRASGVSVLLFYQRTGF